MKACVLIFGSHAARSNKQVRPFCGLTKTKWLNLIQLLEHSNVDAIVLSKTHLRSPDPSHIPWLRELGWDMAATIGPKQKDKQSHNDV